MTIIERLELIRAGYKRAEIDAMVKADEDAAKEKQKDPAPEQEKPKDPEPEKEKPTDPAPEPGNEVDVLKAQIEELKKQIQLNNIKSIGLEKKPDKPVEEVLAEAVFGNPTK